MLIVIRRLCCLRVVRDASPGPLRSRLRVQVGLFIDEALVNVVVVADAYSNLIGVSSHLIADLSTRFVTRSTVELERGNFYFAALIRVVFVLVSDSNVADDFAAFTA